MVQKEIQDLEETMGRKVIIHKKMIIMHMALHVYS